MRRIQVSFNIFALLLAVGSCSFASAPPSPYTVTFEEISPGQDVSYYYNNPRYALDMVPGWEVVGSAAHGWGTPHSGTQAAIWNGNPLFGTGWGFGVDAVSEYTVRSVGAYFTTAPGVVLEMCGFEAGNLITVRIGDTDGSWTNRYAEINSPTGRIAFVYIVGISSPDARYHFAMDDLTVVPVPEPSSLAALLAGVAGFGAVLRRRTR